MNNKIDINTLQKLRNGSHNAFDLVFMCYFPKIKVFILGILKSESEAEELAQDIFVKLWIGRGNINPEGNFNAYLYTMARNTVFNSLKRKQIHNKYELNYLNTNNEAVTIDGAMYAKEIALLIELCIDKMPTQRQKIYRMSRNLGLCNDKIALELNISKKTVENQLSIVLRELKQLVVNLKMILF